MDLLLDFSPCLLSVYVLSAHKLPSFIALGKRGKKMFQFNTKISDTI